MCEFHKVTDEESPVVNHWLKSHLPDSWRVYASSREQLRGVWHGLTFYTLGWPEIQGVVEEMDSSKHPYPLLWSAVNLKAMYAPDPKDVEFMLNQHHDWAKPFLFMGINNDIASLVFQLLKEKSVEHVVHTTLDMMQIDPGDIKPRPIPDGFTIRPLDPEREAEFCASTWHWQTPLTTGYFKALMTHLPNLCLANSDDECVTFELGTEYGNLGMLYTREEYRGRGLGKVLVSHLVQEYFKHGLPAVAWVEKSNEVSYQMHLSLGFKKITTCNILIVLPPDAKDKKHELLYFYARAQNASK